MQTTRRPDSGYCLLHSKKLFGKFNPTGIMKPSPLRTLLARRTCSCNLTPSIQLRYEGHRFRLSPATARLASSYANAPATFGASEDLRRKFQPKPPVSKRINPARQKLLDNIKWYSIGLGICAAGMLGTVWLYSGQLPQKETKQGPKPSARQYTP